jgi:hypothetical protein
LLSESKSLEEIIIEKDLTPLPVSNDGFSGEEEDHGIFLSLVFHFVVMVFPILFLTTIYYAYNQLNEIGLVWTLLFSFPVSWITGDFISGIVHWLCDTYGTEETPVVGKGFIRLFRMHHSYPKDITISPFVYIAGPVSLLAFLTLPIAIGLVMNNSHSFIIAFSAFTYAFITLWTVLTNQFHKWAHSGKTNKAVGFLHKYNIVLNPSHHKLHHTEPFDSNYCITHGWTNPFLEKIRFFRRTENLLAKIGLKKTIF